MQSIYNAYILSHAPIVFLHLGPVLMCLSSQILAVGAEQSLRQFDMNGAILAQIQ